MGTLIVGLILAAIVGAIVYSMIKQRIANKDCPTAYCASCPVSKTCTPIKIKKSNIVDVNLKV
jgi:hypothetical protein